jgi:predicted NUDIX family NTP pyrophosphohydrolase
MAKQNISAGLLMCSATESELHFLLVHPGGPFFKNKNSGAWTIPKGIPESPNEDLLAVAIREFEEETGIKSAAPYHEIGSVQQKGGKIVHAWTFTGNWNPADGIKSNTFKLEWPPRSGKFQDFPEIDDAKWMSYNEAIKQINPAQIELLNRAMKHYQQQAHH